MVNIVTFVHSTSRKVEFRFDNKTFNYCYIIFGVEREIREDLGQEVSD